MKFSFCNWDWRPAILLEDDALGLQAWAVLDADNPRWEEVDAADVFHTAGVMEENDFWEMFPEAFDIREDLAKTIFRLASAARKAAE